MTLPIGKLLLASSTVLVPASIVTATSLTGVFSSSTKSTREVSDLEKRCYVIPTQDSSQQAKLLACNQKDNYNTEVEYLLYNYSNKQEAVKVIDIKKDNHQLTISLENQIPRETITLKINQQDWKDIATNLNLKDDCDLVIHQEEHGGVTWQCNLDTSGNKSIKLSKFQTN